MHWSVSGITNRCAAVLVPRVLHDSTLRMTEATDLGHWPRPKASRFVSWQSFNAVSPRAGNSSRSVIPSLRVSMPVLQYRFKRMIPITSNRAAVRSDYGSMRFRRYVLVALRSSLDP